MITIDLAGKTAVVTGGGSGIGAQTSRRLHEAGVNLVVNYFDDPNGVCRKQAEQLVQNLGSRAIAVAADVRNPQQLDAMFEQAIEQFGSLDILINNAGILRDKTMKKMTHEDFQAVIDTNLTGVFNASKSAAERMNHAGRIVNMSSIAGVIGIFGQSNYAAAKAGIIGMTKVMSKELAKRQITVNAVAPGVVDAGMGLIIPEEHRQAMLREVPLARFAAPSDISNAILFLCSDLASYITGQTIHVNGGWWG